MAVPDLENADKWFGGRKGGKGSIASAPTFHALCDKRGAGK